LIFTFCASRPTGIRTGENCYDIGAVGAA